MTQSLPTNAGAFGISLDCHLLVCQGARDFVSPGREAGPQGYPLALIGSASGWQQRPRLGCSLLSPISAVKTLACSVGLPVPPPAR